MLGTSILWIALLTFGSWATFTLFLCCLRDAVMSQLLWLPLLPGIETLQLYVCLRTSIRQFLPIHHVYGVG